MRRYKITVMVPRSKEVVVADEAAAHRAAIQFATDQHKDSLLAIVHSIEYIGAVQTEALDFKT